MQLGRSDPVQGSEIRYLDTTSNQKRVREEDLPQSSAEEIQPSEQEKQNNLSASKRYRVDTEKTEVKERVKRQISEVLPFEKQAGEGKEGTSLPPKKKARIEEGNLDPLQDFISFSIIEEIGEEPKVVKILKDPLLNSPSKYFQVLFSGTYSENFNEVIKIREISFTHFKMLKHWIEAPSLPHYHDLKINEVFDFIREAHRFDLPCLIEDYDEALAHKIPEISLEEAFNVMEELTLWEETSFTQTTLQLIDKLKQSGLGLAPSWGAPELLFSSPPSFLLTITEQFFPYLEIFSSLDS